MLCLLILAKSELVLVYEVNFNLLSTNQSLAFYHGYKQMKRFLASALFCSTVFAQTVQADLVSDSELIMDKAEKLYPALFPSNQSTQHQNTYRYRFYPSKNIYLGINQNDSGVYLMGGEFGEEPYYVGQTETVTALLNSKETTSSELSFTSFSFLKKDNPQLSEDIKLDIEGNKIKGSVPFNIVRDNLIATFSFNGADVTIGETHQESSQSKNNYQKIVSYHVIGESGDVHQYDVDVVRFTGLPLIFINTDDQVAIDSKDESRKGNVKIVGNRGFDNLDVPMTVRVRGNSSKDLSPKKSYQMKLSNKSEFLGMPADKKWVFLAEYFDKTMLRNKAAFELSKLSSLDWTPSSVYAEVFVNNEYTGTYHITQKVERSKNRVDIGKKGFLLEVDQLKRLDEGDIYFNSFKYLFKIKEPKLIKYDVAYQYIENYVTEFEQALYGKDFKNPAEGYAKYIDVDSFVDWYLVSEITKNVDALGYSGIYVNLIPGEKLKMGALWDFDLAFGNVDYADPEHPTGFWVKNNDWIARLFEDPDFVSKVKERFAYYRGKEAFIQSIIDQYATKLDKSQRENDRVWETIGIKVWPNPVWFSTYALEVEYLKSWFSQRMDWLDEAYQGL